MRLFFPEFISEIAENEFKQYIGIAYAHFEWIAGHKKHIGILLYSIPKVTKTSLRKGMLIFVYKFVDTHVCLELTEVLLNLSD